MRYTEREIEFAMVWGRWTRERALAEMAEREDQYNFCPVCAHRPLRKAVDPTASPIRHAAGCPREQGKVPMFIRTCDLALGDVIEVIENSPWGSGIVEKIDDDTVRIFRPYGGSLDFSTTGGVITYTGHEDVVYPRNNDRAFRVYERKALA